MLRLRSRQVFSRCLREVGFLNVRPSHTVREEPDVRFSSRETALYTSQSGKTRAGGDYRSVAVEQLPSLRFRGNWAGRRE